MERAELFPRIQCMGGFAGATRIADEMCFFGSACNIDAFSLGKIAGLTGRHSAEEFG